MGSVSWKQTLGLNWIRSSHCTSQFLRCLVCLEWIHYGCLLVSPHASWVFTFELLRCADVSTQRVPMEPLELKGTIGLRVSLQVVDDPLASLHAKTKVRHYMLSLLVFLGTFWVTRVRLEDGVSCVSAVALVHTVLLCTLFLFRSLFTVADSRNSPHFPLSMSLQACTFFLGLLLCIKGSSS